MGSLLFRPLGSLCCTFFGSFDNRFLAKKSREKKDQRLYYLDYYRGFTHTHNSGKSQKKRFFLSLIRIFQRHTVDPKATR